MMKAEWNVRFNRKGEPGREVPVEKRIQWGGKCIYIPAVYLCEEGLVLDICTEIDPQIVRDFLDVWEPKIERGLTEEEHRILRSQHPLNPDFHCQLIVNGIQMRNWHSNGSNWLPETARPKTEEFSEQTRPYLEHYGLAEDRVWRFQRIFYSWENGPQKMDSMEVLLSMDHREYPGKPFLMPGIGKTVALQNPCTDVLHTLTVLDIQQQSIPVPAQYAEYEMPTEAAVMVYRLEPDLPHEQFQLRDIQPSDQARKKDGSPYNAGCVGMMLRLPRDGSHAAASSMRFHAPESVLWVPVFRTKIVEDISVKLS